MQDFVNKKILLGICGGIAAYKAAYLVRELTALGAQVRVMMTNSAQQFISALTFQALTGEEVRTELFDSQAERAMSHIELARWADYLVIAPASANCMAKMAHGLADDLITTVYLASEAPVIICPAMNKSMWAHQATQANTQLLLERGVLIIGPEEGAQACGEYGQGRFSDVEEIINSIRYYPLRDCLKNKKVLITAGPTREAIDPVRYLSNYSSGKMGYRLALAAKYAGAEVTLISGPTQLSVPTGVTYYSVESARAMYDAVMDHLEQDSIFIATAAVADYGIQSSASEKIKKQSAPNLVLALELNPDILSAVVASKKASFVVGFAAETSNLIQYAREKLELKKLDMIIANQVGPAIGFESENNQVTIITKNAMLELALMPKTELAREIIAILNLTLQNTGNHRHREEDLLKGA